MRFITKWALALLPALALATPAFAQSVLNDSEEPGSVIIFPKFIGGAPGAPGSAPRVHVDGIAGIARTEIEVGLVCPPALVGSNSPLCAEHTLYKIRFHWVCPGQENVNSNICKESNFEFFISMNGKVAFSADGDPINSNSPNATVPPCPRGYLIGWVENTNDQPIRFDGLIGNAVIRGPDIVSAGNNSTAVSAYNAIPIQASDVPGAPGALPAIGQPLSIGDAQDSNALIFDGAPGHYKAITGSFYGDVRYDKIAPGAPLPDVLSETFITFLTLDVRSNKPNNSVFVPLWFFSESAKVPNANNNDFERLVSTSWNFVCWDQVQLSTIDPNLTQARMLTRKGVVLAGRPTGAITMKDPDGAPNDDFGNEVTLIGLIETIEGTAPNFQERKYNFNTVNNSVPVFTKFIPFP